MVSGVSMKVLPDDEMNEPLRIESGYSGGRIYDAYDIDRVAHAAVYLLETLQMINPESVKKIYLSEIGQKMKRKDSNRDFLPPITDLIIICYNIHDVFYQREKLYIKYLQPLEFLYSNYRRSNSRWKNNRQRRENDNKIAYLCARIEN